VEIERAGGRLMLQVPPAELQPPSGLIGLSFTGPALLLAAGLLAALWLRPRDSTWWVLVLLFYDTALWLASGFGQRQAGGAVVFHAVIWFFGPLAIHLHLLLPDPLLSARRRRLVVTVLYSLAVAGAVMDAMVVLPSFLMLVPFAGGIVGSLALLGLRLRRRPEAVVRVMAWGVGLSLLPFAVIYLAVPALVLAGRMDLQQANDGSLALGLLGLLALPMLPASYLYAIHRRRLGGLEIRASRLAGAYVYAGTVLGAWALAVFALASAIPALRGAGAVAVLALVTASAVAATLLRRPFQRLVDRRVFGIRHAPEEVVALVAERVPRAFDRRLLSDLLASDVLPALLVRESALIVRGQGPEVLYARGVEAPGAEVAAAWLERIAPHRAPLVVADRGGAADWVRIAIPLRIQERSIGVWLLGRRDPDDRYGATATRLLSTVAHQVAPMLENVRLFEQARHSETRFRALFAATPEGIAIVRQGTVVAVNPALLALLGLAELAVVGRAFRDLVDVELRPDGQPRETTLQGRKGERAVEVAARADELQGEAVEVVSVRDITERRADETRNRELTRQLLQAQKMEAVGRLSAGVAHDFNNCLLAIFGQVELLRQNHAGDPALLADLDDIQGAAERAAALTRQLLAFARRQPMQPRRVDPNAIVAGMTSMLERVLGGATRTSVDLEPDLGEVLVDPGPLEQVLLNLAVNARDAMPLGGTLEVRSRRVDLVEGLAVGAPDLEPGPFVAISVSDNGAGMRPETLARVFEPFFTTKPEGTGLGLATAYGVVRQSGGHIAAQSRLGQGTTFTVYLPLVAPVSAAAREPLAVPSESEEPSPASAPDAARTVLVVEDEPLGRRVLAQLLERAGYRVLVAGSGEEALAEAARGGALDVLLTDVEMAGIPGTELAERLQAIHPRLHVVFMTGHDAGRLRGRPALLKPFSRDALLRAVAAEAATPAVTRS
jgi:PAS domain S-box-containing protein